MPRTKKGEKITWKEFFKRWKKGIEGVTPYQQAKMMFLSTWIVLIGIILGILFASIAIKELYWLLIILIGALFNTTIQQLGNYQRMSLLKSLEGGAYEQERFH